MQNSFRTICSANQLSIHGAIDNGCAELTKQIPGESFSSMEKSIAKVNEQPYRKWKLEEVNTLVETLETKVQAPRDRLREYQGKFGNLSREIRVSQFCESAGVMKKILFGQYIRTMHDVNDGFGGKAGSCGEYTLPCDHQDSEPVGWIQRHTPGTVHFVKSGSYVVLVNIELRYRHLQHQETDLSSRPNLYVDESWHDREDPPQDVELVSSTSAEQSHVVTYVKTTRQKTRFRSVNYSRILDTDQN